VKSRRGLDTRILVIAVVVIVGVLISAGLPMLVNRQGGQVAGDEYAGTVKIGVSVSLTGRHAAVGQEYLNGLQLWADMVNERGGIVVAGKPYKVQLVVEDDESSAEKARQIYYDFIHKVYVDYLISPAVDDLAQPVVEIAEQGNTILIYTASLDTVFGLGYKHIYQIATPASELLIPAVETVTAADPEARKIAMIFLDSQLSRRVAEGVKTWLLAQGGYTITAEYYYDPGTTDFQRIIRVLLQNPPDILIGGGGINETLALAQQVYEAGVPVKAVILLDAPLLDSFASLGEAALGVISVSEWERTAAWNPFVAQQLGYEWYGIYVRDFVVRYQERYGTVPTSIAAKAFAAGLILEYALSNSASVTTNDVMKALDNSKILTFYGPIQFDTRPETHGLQIAHKPVIIQWQEQDGEPVKAVIAPPEIATGTLLYPVPWGQP